MRLEMEWEAEQEARGKDGMYWLLTAEYLAGEDLFMEIWDEEDDDL